VTLRARARAFRRALLAELTSTASSPQPGAMQLRVSCHLSTKHDAPRAEAL
jgi:hypothetical protein